MATNQTIDGVWRSTLDRALNGCGLEKTEALKELRALLDAERCTSCDGSGDLTDLTGEWRGYCVCPIGVALKNKPATGTPGGWVAWQYRVSAGPQTGWSLWHDGKGGEFKQSYQVETRPLYAEQPARVAVVMPERPYASEEDQQSMTEYEIGLGHGACEMWDKIKTLNATRPHHANQPPGTEPSGTHHDNDGLDEWRKP